MRSLRLLLLFLAVQLGVVAGLAQAAVIHYSERALVSGSIGGASFNGRFLEITGIADTATVVNDADVFFTNTAVTSFTLDGFGSGSFLGGSSYWYVLQVDAPVIAGGFYVEGATLAETGTVLGTESPAFANDDYRLAGVYGPITSTAFIRNDPGFLGFDTSLGTLLLTSSDESTFRAFVPGQRTVPEPGSLALLAFAVVALASTRRRAPR